MLFDIKIVRIGSAAAALAAACVLGGCGGIEGDLLDALRAKEQRPLLVSPSVLGVDAFEAPDGKRYVAKAGSVSFFPGGSSVDCLEALREEGYASEEPVSLPRGFGESFDAYEITAKGAKLFQPNEFSGELEALVGERVATEIVEYTEPSDGGPKMTEARFAYEIELDGVVDDLGVEEELEAELERLMPGEGTAVFTKTSKGWRLEHAMWQ